MEKRIPSEGSTVKPQVMRALPTEGKVVYLVVSAASKVRILPELIDKLHKLRVQIYIVPTPNSVPLVAELKLQESAWLHIVDGHKALSLTAGSAQKFQLAKEDAIIVAPCTFNTLSKLAAGITDSYALTLVANAFATKTPVIIAPSYDTLWHHPRNMEYMNTLRTWGGRVIYPDLETDHITMVCTDKIVDTFHATVSKVKFASRLLEGIEYEAIRRRALADHLAAFREVGETAALDGLNSSIHGCLSVRLDGQRVLITATGSTLSSLQDEDLTVVDLPASLDAQEIHWHGQRPPSSETPLHLAIYAACPDAQAVLHTHCPDITYNPSYRDLKTEAYVPYGEFAVYDQMKDVLQANNGFGIMRMHGEVAYGSSLEDTYGKLRQYLPRKEKVGEP